MQDKYKVLILDSSTDEHTTFYVDSDTYRGALQKAYEQMNDNDILCDIRKAE